MADDPNKKGRDAKTVSQQPHEQAYQKRKAAGKTGAKSKSSGGSKSSGKGSSKSK
ncbi:MAG: hypothetical protein ABR502_04915 [Chitinophagaceae bacterium]